jgi:hypothetical protein
LPEPRQRGGHRFTVSLGVSSRQVHDELGEAGARVALRSREEIIHVAAVGELQRAALEPGVYDPGNTGCPIATYSNGVLHLEKNCPTPTLAAAGADITGLNGQTFQSASFTLASTTQCQGGSLRFNVETPTAKAQCKKGGWKSFNNPSFKNQGQCVSYVEHHSNHGKTKTKAKHSLKHHAG